MKVVPLLALAVAILALIISGSLYFSLHEKDVFEVKQYKYFSDDEVHVTVQLKSGHLEQYLCAFPPNTDYQRMKKIRVGKMKASYLLGGAVYYCNAVM